MNAKSKTKTTKLISFRVEFATPANPKCWTYDVDSDRQTVKGIRMMARLHRKHHPSDKVRIVKLMTVETVFQTYA